MQHYKSSLPLILALALSPALVFAGNSQKTSNERGTITAIDTSSHLLTVTGKKNHKETKFQWDDRTSFTQHHKTVAASALKDGERVDVTYVPGGNMAMLKSVSILQTGSPKHSADQTTYTKHQKAHPHS